MSLTSGGIGGWFQNAPGNISEWWNKRNAPQIGQDPYQKNWGSLIGQLEQQSSGMGPSLAGNAYRQASADGMRQQMAMSRSGSAGAARQAGMNMATINQGMAQGYANAKLAEQLAARQQLAGALQGATQGWFMPQQANLNAQMQTPNNGQQLMAILAQIAAAGGTIAGK